MRRALPDGRLWGQIIFRHRGDVIHTVKAPFSADERWDTPPKPVRRDVAKILWPKIRGRVTVQAVPWEARHGR